MRLLRRGSSPKALTFAEHEFALDVRASVKVDQLDHVHQLVQLLGDLLDDVVRAAGDDGEARQGFVVRWSRR